MMPIFRHDSPYHTPISLLAWHIVTGILYVIFLALLMLTELVHPSFEVWERFYSVKVRYHKMLVQGMQKTAEDTALNLSSEVDTRALMWTFNCLDEDHELERFFAGLPGLRSSKLVDDLILSLTSEQKWNLFGALNGLLDRTFSSDLLLTPVKKRRALICAKAAYPTHIPNAFIVLDQILSEYQYSGPMAAEVVNILRAWENDMDAYNVLCAKAIITMTVVKQPRDDAWYILASHELGVTAAALRTYAAHGDSLSLAILIHVVRQQFSHYGKRLWVYDFLTVLEASKFDVQDTSPELQREFCALWHQIVRIVQNHDNYPMAFRVLGKIRNVYLVLHEDTDCAPTRLSPSIDNDDVILRQPFSYPVCNIPAHQTDSTPYIHDGSTSTAFVYNATLVPSSLASPDPLPLSPDVPLHVDGSLTDALTDAPPPLEHKISLPVSSQPVDKTTTESRRLPATSPNPVITRATHGNIETSPRLTYLTTLEPSASHTPPMPKASTCPPDAIAVEHTAVNPTPSDGLGIPSPPSPTPVLDDMCPTGPPLSTDHLVTRSDRPFSCQDTLLVNSYLLHLII